MSEFDALLIQKSVMPLLLSAGLELLAECENEEHDLPVEVVEEAQRFRALIDEHVEVVTFDV